MDAKKDFMYVLIGLAVIYTIWLFTGGPERYKTAKPLLNSGSYNQEPTQYGN